MKKGQIIAAALGTAALAAGIYLGFIRKGADGLSVFSRFMKKKNDENQPKDEPKKDDSVLIPKEHKIPHTTAPKVEPTPVAIDTSKSIDSFKGTLIKAPADGVKLYGVKSNKVFKTYKKGESIGTIGINSNNGYHEMEGVAGSFGEKMKLYDVWIKMAIK